MALRKRYKDDFEKKHGIRLGFMSAFMAGAVQALKDQPVINAVIDGQDIVYRDSIDISVAVASPKVCVRFLFVCVCVCVCVCVFLSPVLLSLCLSLSVPAWTSP